MERVRRSWLRWRLAHGRMGAQPAGARDRFVAALVVSEYQRALPDLTAADIVGSPYAIQRYEGDATLGGPERSGRFDSGSVQRGLRLILDFVPNHLAIDHTWLVEHPDRFVQAEPIDRQVSRRITSRVRSTGRRRIFAHGRDPNYSGWTDTVQLDYRSAATRGRAITDVLVSDRRRSATASAAIWPCS